MGMFLFTRDIFLFFQNTNIYFIFQETEEDSTVGVEGIIHYVIGRYPSSREAKDPVQRKYEVYEWRKRLRQFHAGKKNIPSSSN